MNDKKITERTIKNNKKETLQKRIFLLYIPGTIAIAFAIAYVMTQNMTFLWLFGLFSFITIFGIDGNSKVCENCHKWGSVNWTLEKGKEEVQEIITENAFGKRQKTYKKRNSKTSAVSENYISFQIEIKSFLMNIKFSFAFLR